MEVGILSVLLLNAAICLFIFYAGYCKANAKMYEKVVDGYIRMHFDKMMLRKK